MWTRATFVTHLNLILSHAEGLGLQWMNLGDTIQPITRFNEGAIYGDVARVKRHQQCVQAQRVMGTRGHGLLGPGCPLQGRGQSGALMEAAHGTLCEPCPQLCAA